MLINNLIAATYAPMNQDGSLNTKIIKTYTDFHIKKKVKGFFMKGTTGDFCSLNF